MAEYAFKIWVDTEEGIARAQEILAEALRGTTLNLLDSEFDWSWN